MINVTPTASLLEIIYTAFSLMGIAVMAYATIDNRSDLQVLKVRGVNSYSRLTASIGVWDSVAAGLFHVLFFVLGVLGLMAAPPPPDRATMSTIFTLGFIAMQMLILGVQVRNQIARLRIRRRLSRQLSFADVSSKEP